MKPTSQRLQRWLVVSNQRRIAAFYCCISPVFRIYQIIPKGTICCRLAIPLKAYYPSRPPRIWFEQSYADGIARRRYWLRASEKINHPSRLSLRLSAAFQKGLHTMSMRAFLRLADRPISCAICAIYFFRGPYLDPDDLKGMSERLQDIREPWWKPAQTGSRERYLKMFPQSPWLAFFSRHHASVEIMFQQGFLGQGLGMLASQHT